MNERGRLVAAIHLAMRAGEVRPEMTPEELADALYAHGIKPPLHLPDRKRISDSGANVSQRDRLAAALHEMCDPLGATNGSVCDHDFIDADTLLARDVRVLSVIDRSDLYMAIQALHSCGDLSDYRRDQLGSLVLGVDENDR